MIRFAASIVIINEKHYCNYVVELQDNNLISFYPLQSELPQTQWVRSIEINNGKLVQVIRQ